MVWLLLFAVVVAPTVLLLVKRWRSRASRAESRRIALQIIEDRMMLLRALPYAELLKRRGEIAVDVVPTPTRGDYQVETEVMWYDRKAQDNLLITVSVHGGGIGAFMPVLGLFIIAPDGTFVHEPSARSSA